MLVCRQVESYVERIPFRFSLGLIGLPARRYPCVVFVSCMWCICDGGVFVAVVETSGSSTTNHKRDFHPRGQICCCSECLDCSCCVYFR